MIEDRVCTNICNEKSQALAKNLQGFQSPVGKV